MSGRGLRPVTHEYTLLITVEIYCLSIDSGALRELCAHLDGRPGGPGDCDKSITHIMCHGIACVAPGKLEYRTGFYGRWGGLWAGG